MKKILITALMLSVLVLSLGVGLAAKPNKCTTIQDGLLTSGGELIPMGFMDNGYNYQAHIYNGEYSPGWQLVMKWNDAWLSNKDCDGDGSLDRHYGFDSYFGSGAWVTNHWFTTYEGSEGEDCYAEEFIKIVAVPESAYLEDGIWYDSPDMDMKIGQSIWNQFAIIQDNWYDSCDLEGSYELKESRPGLGFW